MSEVLKSACFSVSAWPSVGYYNGVAKVMRTGNVEFGELFNSRGRWLNALLEQKGDLSGIDRCKDAFGKFFALDGNDGDRRLLSHGGCE